MYKIGNFEIDSKVILAPMAGITSFAYRKFMSQFGVGVAVTEMVSDMGLIYGNKETQSYVKFEKLGCLTGVQLFGNSAENIAKSALICLKMNPNIDFFDVNMGCPVNKVFKTGAGSALMKNPKLCGDIIRELKKVTGKSVTAKIRLGVDMKHLTYMEVIKELEDAGVDMIGIHPRTTKELYSGVPHWDLVKDLRKKMSVPLSVSGNIYTVEDAVKALEITGAEAVMVARGGVGHPSLVMNINNYFKEEELFVPSLEDQINWCLELAKDYIEEKGEDVAMRLYRGICTKFFEGFPNSKPLKCRLSTELIKYQDLVDILNAYKSEILL